MFLVSVQSVRVDEPFLVIDESTTVLFFVTMSSRSEVDGSRSMELCLCCTSHNLIKAFAWLHPKWTLRSRNSPRSLTNAFYVDKTSNAAKYEDDYVGFTAITFERRITASRRTSDSASSPTLHTVDTDKIAIRGCRHVRSRNTSLRT